MDNVEYREDDVREILNIAERYSGDIIEREARDAFRECINNVLNKIENRGKDLDTGE